MKQGPELQFVAPSVDAFTEILHRLPATATAVLIGADALAQGIAERCAQGGPTLEVFPVLPPQTVLKRTRVLVLTEQDGERLGDQLLACVDLTEILVLAPVTARHFSKKPIFVVTIPKSGTHLIYQLLHVLGYFPGVEPPDYPKPQTWYCLEYSNTHTVARDFFVDTVRRSAFGNRHHTFALCPVLFGYRHPLDILVSEAHYYHRPGKTIFAGYFAGDDLEARIRRLMDDEWLLGSLRQRVGGFLPWFRFPNVIPASFEELVGKAGGGTAASQQRLIWSIMLKLQVDGSVNTIIPQLFSQNAETFREGQIGSHRKQLPAGLIEELYGRCGDVITEMGYATHGDPQIPILAEQRVKRPLRYSSADFDSMPLSVENDFMGCNLVRYAQRFYAIPISAGPLNVESLSDDQLGGLPSADTLTELKTILQIGRAAYEEQHQQLCQAGLSLQDKAQQTFQNYWAKADAPQVFDTFQGFNFIHWKGIYYAIRQEIGKVDLSLGVSELLSQHTSANILISQSPEALFQLVEGTLAIQKIQETQNTLTERTSDQIRRLDEIVTALSTQMQGLERGVKEIHNTLTERTTDQVRRLDEAARLLTARLQDIEQTAGEAAKDITERTTAQARTLEQKTEELTARLHALEHNFSVCIANFLTRFFRRRG